MTPKILISTSKPNYPEAIRAAGGEPIVGAEAAEVESFDGLLITGGADIAPHRYGEEVRGSVNINEELDAYEHTTLPIIGVQWHPERTTLAHARPDTVDGGALFSHFIELCKGRKKTNNKKIGLSH